MIKRFIDIVVGSVLVFIMLVSTCGINLFIHHCSEDEHISFVESNGDDLECSHHSCGDHSHCDSSRSCGNHSNCNHISYANNSSSDNNNSSCNHHTSDHKCTSHRDVHLYYSLDTETVLLNHNTEYVPTEHTLMYSSNLRDNHYVVDIKYENLRLLCSISESTLAFKSPVSHIFSLGKPKLPYHSI